MPVMALAHMLHSARLGQKPVVPISQLIETLDRTAAYAIQAAGVRLRADAGETLIGGKLGFTSRAMQRAMNVPSPNYGWLTDAMVRGREIHLGELIHPKVEPEIAFKLAADLADAETTADDVLAATESVAACLEVVDSRFVDFVFGPLDNIADNSSAGQVVFGEWTAPPDRLELVGVVLSVDASVTHTASGAAALDDPAEAVAWMARAVAVSDRPLSAGDVVISGGLTAPVTLAAGQSINVEIDRIGTCDIEVRS